MPKAVLIGLSLPAFLQVQIAELQRNNNTTSVGPHFNFVASAYADDPPTVVPQATTLIPDRSIELSTGNSPQSYSAVLYDAAGKERATYAVDNKKFISLPIPDDATSIRFKSGDKQTGDLPRHGYWSGNCFRDQHQ